MTPTSLLLGPLRGALSVLPSRMSSVEAEVMILAIAGQESGLTCRKQIGGAALGWTQFEIGGVIGVAQHPASRAHFQALVVALGYAPGDSIGLIHADMENDDTLAMGISRLLLWTDPHPLPEFGDAGQAWLLYERCWRPGKPRRAAWDGCYAAAIAAVEANPRQGVPA